MDARLIVSEHCAVVECCHCNFAREVGKAASSVFVRVARQSITQHLIGRHGINSRDKKIREFHQYERPTGPVA